MIPANINYGYGQPIYYANQQQYAAPTGIPDAQPSAYPSYEPHAPYGNQQYNQPMVLPANQPYEYGKQLWLTFIIISFIIIYR